MEIRSDGSSRSIKRQRGKKRKRIVIRISALLFAFVAVWATGITVDKAMQALTKVTAPEQIVFAAEKNIELASKDNSDDSNYKIKKTEKSGVIVANSKNPDSGSGSGEALSDRTAWNLMLVNPWNKLPEGFKVERTTLKNGHSIDKRAYGDLQNMMDAARAAGLSPIICSSFRTMEKQQSLFKNQVNKYISRGYDKAAAEKESAKWVAVPGTSEHQSGLAVDIVALSYQLLDKRQEDTAEQKWLMANSYKYGFILRYPSDKSSITGIGYEPWHYRYVGVEAAKDIYTRGICLEEYLGEAATKETGK